MKMKIPNKRELQQIALNHSSDIEFKDFIKIYKKCAAEPYSFLVNGTTLPSDNPLRFRKNLSEENFEIIYDKIITIEDQIRDEKLQYNINREAAKISVLSSRKIDKYEYLTVGEILPSNQHQIIEQAKFTYSPLGKAFEKQTKTIEDQGKNQIEAIQDNKKQLANINKDYKKKLLLSKEREIFKNDYNERLDKIEELNKKIDYNNLRYIVETTGEDFEFDKSEGSLEFLNDFKTGKISLEEAKNLQQNYEEYLKKMRK